VFLFEHDLSQAVACNSKAWHLKLQLSCQIHCIKLDGTGHIKFAPDIAYLLRVFHRQWAYCTPDSGTTALIRHSLGMLHTPFGAAGHLYDDPVSTSSPDCR
jgi:hypothetical protein